jgi:hypothetical protein
MISQTLLEIEQSIRTLSSEEQLWLLERIARHLREQTSATQSSIHQNRLEELSAMACDPDIQAEVVAINKEFAVAEMDGLKNL